MVPEGADYDYDIVFRDCDDFLVAARKLVSLIVEDALSKVEIPKGAIPLAKSEDLLLALEEGARTIWKDR